MYFHVFRPRIGAYPKVDKLGEGKIPNGGVRGSTTLDAFLYTQGGLYCVPNPKVKLLNLSDVVKAMQLKYGIHYVFLGMKKADSMNRRLMLKGYEPTYENNGMCYPLADWTQKDVLSYMKQHRLPTPVRYGLKASNGVGFNLDCFLWLEKNFPQDLKKIYKTFPMAERILWEYHYNNNKQN